MGWMDSVLTERWYQQNLTYGPDFFAEEVTFAAQSHDKA
jgi:hypothetical protein